MEEEEADGAGNFALLLRGGIAVGVENVVVVRRLEDEEKVQEQQLFDVVAVRQDRCIAVRIVDVNLL